MKLIIGAGFLGSALAARLAGKEQIRILNRSDSPLHGKYHIDYVTDDLTDPDWDAVLQDVDLVYAMNGTIISYDGTEGIVRDINEGVIPMLSLVEACKKRGIRRIVFPSSGGTVYGKYATESEEPDPTVPYSVYAAHKIVLENYFKLYNLYDGMEIFSLRIANPYGYLDTTNRKQGIIPIFIDRIIRYQPIEVWGDGNNTRDYVYIDDLINALEAVAAYSGAERCFNIGTGVAASINDVIRMIEAYAGKQAIVSYRPGRICDAETSSLNIGLAVRELKWKPFVTLDQGVKRLVDRYHF